MESNFGRSLAHTLDHEGGFVHDLRDPGGATMRGVTQAVYDRFRGKGDLPLQSVQLITDEELHAIYRDDYWVPIGGDGLAKGIDYCVFDAAVNAGPGHAVRWLHHAREQNPDPREVISGVCAQRLAYCRTLRIWHVFGSNWTRRIVKVEAQAHAMLEDR